MNAREFIALADHLAAFQSVMTGVLKKETAEAKEALAILGSAKELTDLSGKMGKEKKAFEDYKSEVEGILQGSKEELKTFENKLKAKEESLVSKEDELAQKQSAVSAASAKAREELAVIKKEFDEVKVTLDKTNKDIADQYATLEREITKVEKREAAVAAKLAALKALV